jgi:hypothetical protein
LIMILEIIYRPIVAQLQTECLEKQIKVRFSTGEIYAWKTVGDMCKSISEKVPA